MSVTNKALSLCASAALTAALVGAGSASAATRGATTPRASVTVTYMTWETPQTDASLDAAMATFMKTHPGIKVQRIPATGANYQQKLSSLILAHKLPDLFWAGNDTEQQYATQGILYDWSKYAQSTHTSSFDVKRFAPASIQNWSANGRLYGLPSLMNTYGVWYNAALFKAAKLPLPHIGWTYAEMLHDAQVLTQKSGGKVTRYGLVAPPDDPFAIGEYAMSAGGQPFANDILHPTKVTASPQFIQGATLFRDATVKGYVTPPGYDASTAATDFSGGKIPMLYGGQWLAAGFLLSPPKFQYQFAPVPIVSKRVQPYDAVGIVSPKYIANPDAVWQVFQYLDTAAWENVLPAAPVAPAAYVPASQPYFAKLKSAGLESTAASVNYELTTPTKAGIRFLTSWATKANDVITAQWNNILLGKTPVKSGTASMVNAINGVIQQNQ